MLHTKAIACPAQPATRQAKSSTTATRQVMTASDGTREINPELFAHHPDHPISRENINEIVDRRNNFASIHNWEGLK
ncbi:hypothetical protein ACTJLC_31035 [Paraburkholderia sp. 22099]|uniref:hypothetical protein n=1 Tax=Paraburkholderia sp. 22099 TaxID=3453875 RepID=UPI003F86B090